MTVVLRCNLSWNAMSKGEVGHTWNDKNNQSSMDPSFQNYYLVKRKGNQKLKPWIYPRPNPPKTHMTAF